VLPILNLNGYKIANPTILARVSHEELEALFVGYGYAPHFVEGSDHAEMHRKMASTLDAVIAEIRAIHERARANPNGERPRWPMIVLRTPKGWTGPKEINGHKVEGSWRSHQVPFADVRTNSANLEVLEQWLRSYRPEELFDADGRLIPDLRALAPEGPRRMSANPHANGGVLRKELKLPDFRAYAVEVLHAGKVLHENTRPLGEFLRDTMSQNMSTFRVFRPGRDGVEPSSGDLRGQQKDVDGRDASRGRRRRRTGPRRARDGNAVGAYADGMARRLSAVGPPRLLPHL
jgi:xylulose-5-phosphate/fructose-6-phosphate phosphoketolase